MTIPATTKGPALSVARHVSLIVFLLGLVTLPRNNVQAFTLDDVVLHGANDDCWTVFDGTVYDITGYAPNHPNTLVFSMCGKDGTDSFNSVHSKSPNYLQLFGGIENLGPIETVVVTNEPTKVPATANPTKAPATTAPVESASTQSPVTITRFPLASPVPMTQFPTKEPMANTPVFDPLSEEATDTPSLASPQISLGELGWHNIPEDCWISFHGNVYDVTTFIILHPGGPDWLSQHCGTDGTAAFDQWHDLNTLDIYARFYLQGPLEKLMSKDEVAQYNYTENCLVYYQDFVFNVTAYAERQPITVYLSRLIHIDVSSMPCGNEVSKGQFVPFLDKMIDYFVARLKEDKSTLITMAELQLHNTPQDCWVAYFGEVYNVTEYAPIHPLGAALITANCGQDGTVPFSTAHGRSQLNDIADYYLGELEVIDFSKPASNITVILAPDDSLVNPAAESGGSIFITKTDLATHSSAADCWVSYFGEVYDVTEYAPTHKIGAAVLTQDCGRDGTGAFTSAHTQGILSVISQHYKGPLDRGAGAPGPSPPSIPAPALGLAPQTGPEDIQSPAPGPSGSSITASELASHSRANDCWVVYHGNVYDVTAYAPTHPAGADIITQSCGGDGTGSFSSVHSQGMLGMISQHKKGPLESGASIPAPAPAPVPQPVPVPAAGGDGTITSAELSQHSSANNCWVAYFGEVYDVTSYAPSHPAGSGVITRDCGGDGTSGFSGAHSRGTLGRISGSFVGMLEGASGSGPMGGEGYGGEGNYDSDDEEEMESEEDDEEMESEEEEDEDRGGGGGGGNEDEDEGGDWMDYYFYRDSDEED